MEQVVRDVQADARMRSAVEEEGEFRGKGQVTVPAAVVKRLGLRPGDRLVWVVREGEPDEIRVRRVRRGYAGALAGVYGTPEEAAAYLRGEAEAWGD